MPGKKIQLRTNVYCLMLSKALSTISSSQAQPSSMIESHNGVDAREELGIKLCSLDLEVKRIIQRLCDKYPNVELDTNFWKREINEGELLPSYIKMIHHLPNDHQLLLAFISNWLNIVKKSWDVAAQCECIEKLIAPSPIARYSALIHKLADIQILEMEYAEKIAPKKDQEEVNVALKEKLQSDVKLFLGQHRQSNFLTGILRITQSLSIYQLIHANQLEEAENKLKTEKNKFKIEYDAAFNVKHESMLVAARPL